MVIELSGVMWSAVWSEIIRNHKYDFRPKLHDTKFNNHFITSILKSHNLIAQIPEKYQYFIDPVADLQKRGTGNALKSRFVCKTERLYLQLDWLLRSLSHLLEIRSD